MPRVNKAEGAVALVTGGNRGIGEAFVEELLARGARHVYAGVRDGSWQPSAGGKVSAVVLDVTDRASVAAAAAACGDVSLLVNNAGYHARDRLVKAADPDAAWREMQVNYFGVLETTRAFAPVLADNRGGAIINVLSVAGAYPAAFMGGYSPAKAAALFLSTIARAELAGQGTEVLPLIVGSVDTRMADYVDGAKAPPRDIARAGLDAWNRGDRICDTDPMAVEARAAYARDPARYERSLAKVLDLPTPSTGR